MSLVFIGLAGKCVYSGMKPIIPISLMRIAARRMQDVERGRMSHSQARDELHKIAAPNRSDLIAYLTEHYSQDAKAFQYFGLL